MSLLTIGGRAVKHGFSPQIITRVPQWSELADVIHAWDFGDVDLVGGRVVRVEDPIGGRPLVKMPGTFPLLGGDPSVGNLPGPLWISSSARFNGRPAVRFDSFPVPGSIFDTFAGLTPNVSHDGTVGPESTDSYFSAPTGYTQPYWVAVLARIGSPDDPLGGETDTAGIWDATHGGDGTGPTIGRKIVGLGDPNWQFSNFGPGLLLITVVHTAVSTETVFVICHVNGASSFLEVTWRDAGGGYHTLRQTGTMLGWNYLECFGGWVHGPYLSAVAIGAGVPDEGQLNRMRHWAKLWMPPAATVAEEP